MASFEDLNPNVLTHVMGFLTPKGDYFTVNRILANVPKDNPKLRDAMIATLLKSREGSKNFYENIDSVVEQFGAKYRDLVPETIAKLGIMDIEYALAGRFVFYQNHKGHWIRFNVDTKESQLVLDAYTVAFRVSQSGQWVMYITHGYNIVLRNVDTDEERVIAEGYNFNPLFVGDRHLITNPPRGIRGLDGTFWPGSEMCSFVVGGTMRVLTRHMDGMLKLWTAEGRLIGSIPGRKDVLGDLWHVGDDDVALVAGLHGIYRVDFKTSTLDLIIKGNVDNVSADGVFSTYGHYIWKNESIIRAIVEDDIDSFNSAFDNGYFYYVSRGALHRLKI